MTFQTRQLTAAPATLTDATRAYSDAMDALFQGLPHAEKVRDAQAALAAGDRGEDACAEALRRCLSAELQEAADRQTERRRQFAAPKVDISALSRSARWIAAPMLRDRGFKVAQKGESADVAVTLPEDLAHVGGLMPAGAAPTRFDVPDVPGLWQSGPKAGRHGGFLHGGILTRQGPDGAPQHVRLIGGRFHQAQRSRGGFRLETSVDMSFLPVNADGTPLADILPMPAPLPSDSIINRFYNANGWSYFRSRTDEGLAVGWSAGNGSKSKGCAIFDSLCRTKDYIERLSRIGQWGSSRNLGREVPLERHPVPLGRKK